MTRGYKESEGMTGDYKGLQGVTRGCKVYKGIQEVTRGYKA